MIKVYRYDLTSGSGSWLSSEEFAGAAESLRVSSEVLWIDLEVPTDAEEQLVFQKFMPIHSLSLEDVTRSERLPDEPPHLPKVEEFPDYLFVIVNPLTQRLLRKASHSGPVNGEDFFADGSPVSQLSAVLTARMLITHHAGPVAGVDRLRTYLEKHSKSAERGPDYLFHVILDEMVDEYAPVLDRFAETLEEYEAILFENPSRQMLAKLIACKRALILLRKTLIHEREILARLARAEFELINDRETVYYRNVYDHLIRFTELIEAGREMVSDLLEMHLASSANHLNEIMKTLTMISTVILPMTLVAGIYGMNFENMKMWLPLTEPRQWVTYLVMALAGLLPLALFKWKKWI